MFHADTIGGTINWEPYQPYSNSMRLMACLLVTPLNTALQTTCISILKNICTNLEFSCLLWLVIMIRLKTASTNYFTLPFYNTVMQVHANKIIM